MDQPQKPKTTENVPEVLEPVKRGGISRSPTARNIRAKQIIEALIEGKNIKQAGISVGYSPQSAGQQACEVLKHPETKRTFAHVMEKAGISDDFLAEKIRSLMDAKETKFFQKDGMVIETHDVDALETQRKTTELATKLKGHLKDRSEIDVNIGLMAMVVAAVKTDQGTGGDDYE